MIPALLWKEWREQRWRGILATLVLTTLSAGLVRAQLMTTPEAVLLIFGPLGLLLTIFLAMGTVATEREDGTWGFLTARPIRRATILRVKWAAGGANLLAALLLAGIAAHAAANSRGLFDVPQVPRELAAYMGSGSPIEAANSPAWLWLIVGTSVLSLAATYSVLFVVLTRARSELHAGLGGVLVTLALLAWLLQFFMAWMDPDWLGSMAASGLQISATINPLSPFVWLFKPGATGMILLGLAFSLTWIGGAFWFIDRFAGERQ